MDDQLSTPPSRSTTTERVHAKVRRKRRKRRAASLAREDPPSLTLGSLRVTNPSLQSKSARSQGSMPSALNVSAVSITARPVEPAPARPLFVIKPMAPAKKPAVSPQIQKLLPVTESTVPFCGEYVHGLRGVTYYPANFKQLYSEGVSAVPESTLVSDTIVKRVYVPRKPVSITEQLDCSDNFDEAPAAVSIIASTSTGVSASAAASASEPLSLVNSTSSVSTSALVSSLPVLKKTSQFNKKPESEPLAIREDNTIRVYTAFNLFMVPKRDNAIISRYGSYIVAALKQFERRISYLSARYAAEIPALQGQNVPRNIVVFKGGYPDFKKYFVEKGWVVNPEKDTTSDFNIKFAVKTADLDRTNLYPWQYTNHFTNSQILTTKNGIIKCLANDEFDNAMDRFFPRSYRVVNISEGDSQAQLQLMSGNDDTIDFIEDFLNTEALKICFEWIRDPKVCDSVIDYEIQCAESAAASASADSDGRYEIQPSRYYQYSTTQLQLAYRHLLYLTSILLHYDLYLDRKTRYVVAPLTKQEITVLLPRIPHQYQLPNYYSEVTPQNLISPGSPRQTNPRTVRPLRASGGTSNSTGNNASTTSANDIGTHKATCNGAYKDYIVHPYSSSTSEIHANVITAQEYPYIVRAISAYLRFAPQMSIRASMQNIFIGKPGAKSRGRGIFCANDIMKLLILDEGAAELPGFELPDETAINSADRYVVQRYIETPLLLGGYKFDVRQWVLVSSINPLIIFQWTEPYLRFCSSKYSASDDDLKNVYIHLSNNSVQKYASGYSGDDEFLSDGNMWSWSQFAKYLETHVESKPTLNVMTEDDQISCPTHYGCYKADDFILRAPPTSSGDMCAAASGSKHLCQPKMNKQRTRELYKEVEPVVENDNKSCKQSAPKVPLYKQKYSAKEHTSLYRSNLHEAPPRLWTSDYKRSQYSDKNIFDNIADRILYDMARIIVTTIQAARFEITATENNFELFGYDFLIDDALQVWLIEINTSPTLERSTDLVTGLIDRMSHGLVNIITDGALGTKIRTKKRILMPKITNADAVFGSDKGISALEGWKLIYCEKQRFVQHSADVGVFGKEITIPGVVVAE